MEWEFRIHGRSCPLGYNPVTALILPRPIGWISTYSQVGRVPHVAPYSFFSDVARGPAPMVAFSAYRRGENNNSNNNNTIEDHRKDAHKDAEETKCFCFNLVTEDLAVPMNYTSADLPRDASEFELAGLEARPAGTVDAPYVASAHVVYECKYIQTVDVEQFSIVIGAVQRVLVRRAVLLDEGGLDVAKLRPIARMGYLDEYGVLF